MAGDFPHGQAEPDPGRVATAQDFGRELTLARQRAGLTVREAAREAGIPVSTVGDYFSGRHLPAASQPGLLRGLLRACGITDPAELTAWSQALSRARRSPGRRPAAARAPYPGLASFQPEDAPWFFGRDAVTERLVALAGHGPADVPLVVVGPSGSGKSSLLRAGFIPRMRPRPVALFTPTATPLAKLDAQLGRLPADDPGGAPVIVVDQFEAIFTEGAGGCQGSGDGSEAERRAFIDGVCALAGPAVVVLALRADFYDRALRYPGLARALQERQVVLGPMSREEVRAAIVEPARIERLHVEEGLVELLLRDLAPRRAGVPARGVNGDGPHDGTEAAHEAGALPLLSHALLVTWQRSSAGRLTVADYQASGGITDAIRRTADAVYDGLPDDQKDLARRLFLRLVNVTGEAPPVRRLVPLRELDDWLSLRPDDGDVLGRFVDHRLITVGAEDVQISHDALLLAWPRLAGWIAAGLDDLRTRRRITESARAWSEADRDDAALLRGGPLDAVRGWAAGPGNRESLDRLAREFVDTSVAEDKLRQRAERRRTRRLQRLVGALMVLVLAVFGLAGYAFQQRRAADGARAAADSREVAIEANQVRGQSVSLAAQLSLAAYRIAVTPQASASLLESSGTAMAARLVDSQGVVQAVGLDRDGRVLAVAAADGTLRLWDVADPARPVPLGAPLVSKGPKALYATAFSPGGTILAAAGAAGTVSLWDVADPRHPVRLGAPLTGPAGTVYSLAFSPGGRLLAAASADGTVRLWDMTDPRAPRALPALAGSGGPVESVTFSPDGSVVAAGGADKTVRLWRVGDPAHPAALGRPLTGPAALVDSVTFSPDGKTLAAGGRDDKVWLWNTAGLGHVVPDGAPLTGASDWVNAVSFSPGGTSIAAGSSDDDVLVWNLASRQVTAKLPNPQPVTSLYWDGRGRLVAGDADGTVRNWTLPPPVLMAGGPVNSVAFTPDGSLLALGSQDLQLWSASTRRQIAAAAPPAGAIVNAVAFSSAGSPAGRVMAAGYGNGTVQLWLAGQTLVPLGHPVPASASGLVEYVAFSPDGKTLTTAGDDGTVRLWSVAAPAGPRLLATVHDAGTLVFSVAFSPDGRTLAAASADDLTRLGRDRPVPAPAARGAAGRAGQLRHLGGLQPGRRHAGRGQRRPDRTPVGRARRGPAAPHRGPADGPGRVRLLAGVRSRREHAGGRRTVWLWKVSTAAHPALLATLTGPAGHVYSVAFRPGGHELAAASADGTVRLWATRPAAAAGDVCATSGQPLTRAEWATYIPGVAYRPPCGPG